MVKMDCMVCYEEIKNKVTFECKHELCLKCFIIIGKDKIKCPMCIKEIDLDKKEKEEEFHLYINEPNIPTSIKKILQDSFPLYIHLYFRNRNMVFLMK